MPNHTIRRATVADVPRIKEIRFAVTENKLTDPTRVTEADIAWFVANGPIWLWEEVAVICGFSAGDHRDGSIWALFVHPDCEGRGIGQVLLDRACESMRAMGHKSLKLDTGVGTRAARFYEKRGWVDSGRNERGQIIFIKSL